MSDDPYLDFLVAEAVFVKVAKEDQALMEEKKVDEWKGDKQGLRESIATGESQGMM